MALLPPEQWENRFDPEIEAKWKPTKTQVWYDQMLARYWPKVLENFEKDWGNSAYFITPIENVEDNKVQFEIDGKKEIVQHPFVSVKTCEGQPRGGFEIVFLAEEKGTSNFAQCVMYFGQYGVIDVCWTKKQAEDFYRWK